MQLGNVKLKNNLFLAPIAGISSLSFRLIVRKFGAGFCFTEMISSEALVRNNKKTEPLLKTDLKDKPVGTQIFGANPDSMAKAASILESRGFDIVDINAGCPVKKVTKNNAGAALMKNIKLLQEVLKKTRKSVNIPLMLKFRSGWDYRSINCVEIARIAEDSGVDAITVHPRTASQFFRGKADWSIIKKVKEAVKIPVIGNGDVFEPKDAVNMLKQTNCDGVMLGRGAFGNPWIFNNILRLLNCNEVAPEPLLEDRGEVLLKHLDYSIQLTNEKLALLTMRKHYPWYVKNLAGATMFRKNIIQKNSISEVKDEIEKYFFSSLTGKVVRESKPN